MYNFSFKEEAMSNVEGLPTFQEMLQLSESGVISLIGLEAFCVVLAVGGEGVIEWNRVGYSSVGSDHVVNDKRW